MPTLKLLPQVRSFHSLTRQSQSATPDSNSQAHEKAHHTTVGLDNCGTEVGLRKGPRNSTGVTSPTEGRASGFKIQDLCSLSLPHSLSSLFRAQSTRLLQLLLVPHRQGSTPKDELTIPWARPQSWASTNKVKTCYKSVQTIDPNNLCLGKVALFSVNALNDYDTEQPHCGGG